ncbi:MAG: TlpA family protein disulfide reductase [Bacteroidales bacterium]
MLHKSILLTISALCSTLMNAQQTIIIEGIVKNPDNNHQMVVYKMNNRQKEDILTFDLNADNTFKKELIIHEPGIYFLDCQKKQRLTFWAEDEDVNVIFTGKDTARIKSMPILINPGRKNEVMNLYNFANNTYGIRQTDYVIENKEAKESNCNPWIEFNKNQSDKNKKEFADFICFIIESYPNISSVISTLPALEKFDSARFPIYEEIVIRNQKDNPVLISYLKNKSSISPTSTKAPLFSLNDSTYKNKIGPADFQDKLLLLDFWASWCGPCKKAIPELKQLYNQFNSKGFDILSISIDKNSNSWMKSLIEEQMPWKQVISSNGGKDVMSLYNFMLVPTFVLIDRKGNIIQKGIKVDELSSLIEKHIK